VNADELMQLWDERYKRYLLRRPYPVTEAQVEAIREWRTGEARALPTAKDRERAMSALEGSLPRAVA